MLTRKDLGKRFSNKKLVGFTLIELLVVITIIGILASIVVVNLNSARGKGQDTAIKEQMSQMRAQASLYYDDNFGYSKTFAPGGNIEANCPTTNTEESVFAQKDFQRALAALKRNSGAEPKCYLSGGATNSNSQNWALMTKLRTSDGYWCVDSNGNSKEVESDFAPDSKGYTCE